MQFNSNKNILRWFVIFASLVVISIILWNTYIFFQLLKQEEQTKMEIWATAQKDVIRRLDLNQDMGDLPLAVLQANETTPILYIYPDSTFSSLNVVNEKALKDQNLLRATAREYATINEPIQVTHNGKLKGTIYYGESPILTKLRYYPIALLLIIFLFGAVAYFFYRSTKSGEQNKLWAGMAKETAHQIGTPLSSLVGWTTILRDTDAPEDYIIEMEKDVQRLQTIADRFSKIGSIPELQPTDVVQVTRDMLEYLSRRSSKLVQFTYELPEYAIELPLSAPLFSWVIENLIKNGIDAMKGKGTLHVALKDTDRQVFLTVKDSGKGIPKQKWKRVFEPGYTTKKRGWGLGLSLAKRIVETYHRGRIRISESVYQAGTTFEITLRK